jgi:hypothetical protein
MRAHPRHALHAPRTASSATHATSGEERSGGVRLDAPAGSPTATLRRSGRVPHHCGVRVGLNVAVGVDGPSGSTPEAMLQVEGARVQVTLAVATAR